MKAVARARATFALLLALVAVGFLLTARAPGALEARASEPDLIAEHGLPFAGATAEVGAAEPGTDVSGAAAEDPSGGNGRGARSSSNSSAELPGVFPASNGEKAPDEPGNVQLHNMAVWDSPDGSPNVFVSFTPVSSDHMTGEVPFKRELVDGEEVEVADVAPELDESDVRVEVDGSPVEVSAMTWYYAGYGDLAGADTKYMPVCLLRVARPELTGGEHVLRVMVYDADSGALGEKVATFEAGVAEL